LSKQGVFSDLSSKKDHPVASLFHRLFTGEEAEEHSAPTKEGAEAPRPESPDGLIHAGELPPAANALAEIFPEESPAKGAQAEAIGEPIASQPAPRKRSIFLRLFFPQEAPASTPETLLATGDTVQEPPQNEAVAAVESAEPDGSPTANLAPTLGTSEVPISAEELPPAAHVFEQLFPPEETAAEPSVDASADSSPNIADEAPIEAPAEELVNAPEEASSAERENEAPMDAASNENPAEEAEHEDSSSTSHETEAQASATIESSPDERGDAELNDEAHHDLTEVAAEDSYGTADVRATPAPAPAEPRRLYRDWAFDEKLASHREWVDTHGVTGQRADLSCAELEGADLISVNLRLADLHDANLRAADLLLADLRDACLVRADLEEACLVGANLEGANLEGASLETAMGLVPRQVAGANLRDALLAPQLMEFEAFSAFERASRNAFRYFSAMTAASALSWLIVWKTKDIQLLTDSAIIPFLHSRTAAAALPTAESYLIVPAVLFILYLVFQFHLQRMWDSALELPAIFPDGHTLGDRSPAIILGLLRTHFRWMNPDPASTRLVETWGSILLAYWLVPATLLAFWARYLTRQEVHGTILHMVLVVVAAGVALYATTRVGRPQERWALERKWTHRIARELKAISPATVAAALGTVLILLSIGTIAGVPHERSRAPQYGVTSVRRWASNAFSWIGFDPYADLTEAAISRRPANWNGGDDQVPSIDGPRLNNSRFRYAQAYRAFLPNAHLWRANFEGAFLSEADLRSADLGQSNLRFVVMDNAQMNHANLDRSVLDGADLRRTDLHGANLSYSSLAEATLVDARLDGASLYMARLGGATMTRANLQKADLRDAVLSGGHLDHADLRGAYLWSTKLAGADLGGAQLGSAILIDADLHGANLGGAQLSGTVLNGANLSGTSLEGADLRGALGLTASQVCSAKSRRGALLDSEMETQVEAQCGK
jgi:uncharacterized protein YjbI with pentapeptide repeats